MKIAFVEVRDKTSLFEEIANHITNHSVHWLVQNHAFTNSQMANVWRLPYPHRTDLTERNVGLDWLTDEDKQILDKVRQSDRFILYFDRNDEHYIWYLQHIKNWLTTIKPDVIVGEVGNFHTHMTALLAQQGNIPFINPISCRYPTGRFACYLYDRFVSIGGDGTSITDQQIENGLLDLLMGRSRPDYMVLKVGKIAKVVYKIRLFLEYIKGERYATQNPIRNAQRVVRRRLDRARWERQALSIADVEELRASATFLVLYPLQMQPELNLDVWGVRFRNQCDLIEKISKKIREAGGVLLVKPNPKSFYEMTAELTTLVQDTLSVYGLSHAISMRHIVDNCDLVVTVSGTIAMERLAARRPVIVLQDDYANMLGIKDVSKKYYEKDRWTLDDCKYLESLFREYDPLQLLRKIVNNSYAGIIGEPLLSPNILRTNNIAKLCESFNNIFSYLEKYWPTGDYNLEL